MRKRYHCVLSGGKVTVRLLKHGNDEIPGCNGKRKGGKIKKTAADKRTAG